MKLDKRFFTALNEILSSMNRDHYKDVVDHEMKSYLSPEIRIGMWGQFSCGKSSFINALVGKKLLPVNILESTSKVTEVTYGDEDQIVLNPDKENICVEYSPEMAVVSMMGVMSWDDLKPSLKKNLNEENFQQSLKLFKKLKTDLSKVQVKTNAQILKSGIVFVDLPGLNGSTDHSELANGKIHQCEMILYLNDPARPLDAHDMKIIHDLKCENKTRVIFGIRTKSDDLYKMHITESLIQMTDEERYKLFLKDFQNDTKSVSFDDYFLISPLAFSAIADAEGDLKLATMKLKEEHKNKFLFLNENSKIEVISGHKYFNDHFAKSLESKRDEAKMRKVRSSITALLARISQEIYQEWEVLSTQKHLEETDRQKIKIDLERIKAKFAPLRNIRTRYDDLIDHDLRTLSNDLSFDLMIKSVSSLNYTKRYLSPEEIVKEIFEKFHKELMIHMSTSHFQSKIQSVRNMGLAAYRDNLVEIEDLLNDFDKELLRGGLALQSMAKVDMNIDVTMHNEISSATTPSYLSGVAGGVLGGFIIDSSMGFIMESFMGAVTGFGVGTLLVGALKGMSNGRGAIDGIFDQIDDIFDGFGAIFGNESSKASLLCKKLQTSSGQVDFARTMSGQCSGAFHCELKKILVDQVCDALEKQNTIELIWKRFESEQKKLDTIFKSKEKNLKEREAELQKMLQIEKSYVALLSEYKLGELNLKKAA